MFRVEVKHAFKMFLTKTQRELKDAFPDSEQALIQAAYELNMGDEIQKEMKNVDTKEYEGVNGQLCFQIKIIFLK